MTQEELAEVLEVSHQTIISLAKGQFIVVGAAPTVLKVEKNLRAAGVSHQNIHDERLTI